MDISEHGVGGGDELAAQIVVERLTVEFARDVPVGEDGFDLRTEEQLPLVDGVVERLDPDAVAYESEAVARALPDGDGEHAAQFLDDVDAVLFVAVQDHFGIGATAEVVPLLLQLGLEFLEVVDLAIEDQMDVAVATGHGLTAVLAQVDDAEAAVSEGDLVE